MDMKFLQSHALFGGLLKEQLDHLVPLLKEEKYKKDDFIIREGERGNRLFFITSGKVQILKDTWTGSEKIEKKLAVLEKGDTFGEMEMIDVQARSASVQALETVTALSLSNRDLYSLHSSHIDTFTMIMMNLARELSRRLRRMSALVGSSLCAKIPDPSVFDDRYTPAPDGQDSTG